MFKNVRERRLRVGEERNIGHERKQQGSNFVKIVVPKRWLRQLTLIMPHVL